MTPAWDFKISTRAVHRRGYAAACPPIVHAAKADDPVARALVAKRNPVIEAVRAEDRAVSRVEGEINGRIEALLAILAARGIDPGPAREQIVRERDPDRLDRWIIRAATASTLGEVLDGG